MKIKVDHEITKNFLQRHEFVEVGIPLRRVVYPMLPFIIFYGIDLFEQRKINAVVHIPSPPVCEHLALRELAGPGAAIYAVDKDRRSLDALVQAHRALFEDSEHLHLLPADFTGALDTSTGSVQRLPPLDGILMANSLHFFKDKEKILRHVRTFLKPNGILLIVEYNVDTGNLWAPYPLSFDTYRLLAPRAGFNEPRLLATVPSRFLREFYAAMAERLEKTRL